MKHWQKFIFLSVLVLCCCSCADLASVDKSYLNHKAMNFDTNQTDEPTSAFTVLNMSGKAASAGCVTCAK